MISAPFTIVFGIFYTWLLMGWTVVPALGAFFLLMIVNFYFVKMGLRFQKEFMRVRSLRIKLTNEVFENIRFVKTYSLEKFFIEKIVEIRAEELKWLAYIFYRIIYSIANSTFSPGIFLLVLFSCYVAAGNDLTSGKIFTVISIFNSFVISLTYLPNLFSGFIDIVISSERLTKFLMTPDQERRLNRFDASQVGLMKRSEEGYLQLFHEKYVSQRDMIEEGRENLTPFTDPDDGEQIQPVEYSSMEEQDSKLFGKSYALKKGDEDEGDAYSFREVETQNLETGNTTPKGFAGDVLDVQIRGLHFFWKKFWEKKEDEDEEEEKKKKKKEEEAKKKKEKKKEEEEDSDAPEEESEKVDAIDMEKQIDEKFRLKNINFEVKKGEFVCIIGKSGSGKSSLFNAILGELFAVPVSEWASIRQVALNNDVSMVDDSTYVEEFSQTGNFPETQLNGLYKHSLFFSVFLNMDLLSNWIFLSLPLACQPPTIRCFLPSAPVAIIPSKFTNIRDRDGVNPSGASGELQPEPEFRVAKALDPQRDPQGKHSVRPSSRTTPLRQLREVCWTDRRFKDPERW